jgi:methylmalonyl-CoA/ethylmalonyl-CoA epimerase
MQEPGDGVLTFHHLGVASPDLAAEVDTLSSLGYSAAGSPFTDLVLGVRGQFLRGCGPQLEVLEQLPGSTVLDSWLARGVRMYHQAFLADSLETELEQLQARGARLVARPTPAVAFGGRRVCFVMLRDSILTELIEADSGPRPSDPRVVETR